MSEMLDQRTTDCRTPGRPDANHRRKRSRSHIEAARTLRRLRWFPRVVLLTTPSFVGCLTSRSGIVSVSTTPSTRVALIAARILQSTPYSMG